MAILNKLIQTVECEIKSIYMSELAESPRSDDQNYQRDEYIFTIIVMFSWREFEKLLILQMEVRS